MTHEQRKPKLESGLDEALKLANKLSAVLEDAKAYIDGDRLDDRLDEADMLAHEIQRLSNHSWEA